MLTLSSCQKNHQRRDPTDECNSNELGNIRAHAQKNEFFMKNTRHSIFIYFLTYNIYFINSFSHFSHETQKFTLRSLIHTYIRSYDTDDAFSEENSSTEYYSRASVSTTRRATLTHCSAGWEILFASSPHTQ